MRAQTFVVVALLAAGCSGTSAPRLVWEGAGGPRVMGPSTAAEILGPRSPGVRAGIWGPSPAATFQLLEASTAELPHVHREHDLTVVLLRGRGVLWVEDRVHRLRAGDVVHIARGRPHHFHPADGAVLALAIFTPTLDEVDFVPVGK